MAKRLIDRYDILEDIINNISPKYFPKNTIDNNRTSIFGLLSEINAKSIEDTVTLEQYRASNYCPELSSNEITVKETAKIWNVGVNYATPGRAYALIGILKKDVLEKGTRVSNEIRFVIDRRSTIVHNDINFSLEDDIIIRAVKQSTGWIYSANYSGEHATYDSYIQMYEQTNEFEQDMVTMIVQIFQCNYNIQDKIVTDDVEFLYDGLSFDYSNLLAGFDVYYKTPSDHEYKRVEKDHYLTTASSNNIFYNDNDSGIIYILNNPALNIGVNTRIRLEIIETLGTEGITTIGDFNTTFSLYRDGVYNYAGVNVDITMLSDTIGASNGDTLEDIKRALIDKKTRRDNITTEHDIISYINDIDANVQIVKKRNDIEDRRYYMYTLLRYQSEIVPANTMQLNLNGVQSVVDFGDFDHYDKLVDRKVLRAYNKFKYQYDEENKIYYATKVPHDENEPNVFYFTCPFMILINKYEIASYYFTSINTSILLSGKANNNIFPFQMICRQVDIYRDSHNPDAYDQYRFTVTGTLNTANDTNIINDDGTIKDDTSIMCYIIFKHEGTPAAYLPMKISGYIKETREFSFIGTITTTDYITEQDGLEINHGLYKLGQTTRYNSTIDYKDAQFEVYFMYRYNDEFHDYPNSDVIFQYLPSEYSEGYELMCSYYNNPNNLYYLILEYNKFTSSPVQVSKTSDTVYSYAIGEVPLIRYDYGLTHIIDMYDTFEKMANTYGSLLKLTSDFEVSLKFIATYGHSRYITVVGGQDVTGEEIEVDLHNLNPVYHFKIYGNRVDINAVRQFIYEYLRDNYITDNTVFISNICTLVEQEFSSTIRSIKYMGVDSLDASYQEFVYKRPDIKNIADMMKFVPEQLNATDIQIVLDEN